MSKVGYRCPFCPKVRFTRCCPALRFWPKSHARTMFSPRFHFPEEGLVDIGRFARKSVLHDVAPCCVFGQNHMRAPCFRPVFMYMSKDSCTSACSGTDARLARE